MRTSKRPFKKVVCEEKSLKIFSYIIKVKQKLLSTYQCEISGKRGAWPKEMTKQSVE